MKPIKLHLLSFIVCVFLISCSKETPSNEETNTGTLVEQATNVNEPVKIGEANCTEAITGKIKLKPLVDASQSTSSSTAVKIESKTEKLYPSGGYILVYDLKRTSNNITLEYTQVNTACGNPAAAAFLPATSSPRITNLAPGSYPIHIKVNGVVNQGVLVIPSQGSPTLTMQSTNGIVIE